VEWVLGVASTVIGGLLVWSIRSNLSVAKSLGTFKADVEKFVSEKLAKEKQESILGHRRIDVLDRTLSDITEEKFNSRNVVEGKDKLPRISRPIRKILHGADE
jgi:hypothetical protein